MVDAIEPISGAAPTFATKVDISTSITAEPDNAWVAMRQAQMTADLLALQQAHERNRPAGEEPATETPARAMLVDDRHPQRREGDEASGGSQAGEEHGEPTLSGESDRIGTWNFDDDTPFGERVAIV